jgi:hypothetical protein
MCSLGVVIAASVRPYAAAFLAAGVALVSVHVVLRSVDGRRRAATAALLAAAAVGVGGLLFFSSWGDARLARLQFFQDSQREVGNLPLDAVDLTTPEGLARGIPLRTWDLLVRPYPWEQQNLSQRLAILGTIPTWLLTLAILIALLRRRFVSNALPVAYMLFAVAIGYAATTANAGTGFRHRMHVVVLLSALAAIVWLKREPSRSIPSKDAHPAPSPP